MQTLLSIVALFTIFLPLVLSGSQGTSGTIPPMQNESRKNVIVIVLDDENADIELLGGIAKTPNMQWIASRGTLYTNAVSNSTGCNPSRVSFSTGLLPLTNCITSMEDVNTYGTSMVDWRTYMDQCPAAIQKMGANSGRDIKTLWRLFSDSGYYTFASGKVLHKLAQQRTEFDGNYWQSPTELQAKAGNIPLHGLTELYSNGSTLRDWGKIEDLAGKNGEHFTDSDHPDWKITDEFIEMLNNRPVNKPFIGAIGLISPHTPRYVPKRLYDLYANADLPDVLANDFDDIPSRGQKLGNNNSDNRIFVRSVLNSYPAWRDFTRTYYASITYADEQIGRVIEALNKTGELNNTIIVVWSDHGYHLGQKLRMEKGTVWSESYHIPLIVSIPGISPSVVTQTVNSVDVLPTLLDATHVQLDRYPRDGKTLIPVMQGNYDNRIGIVVFNENMAVRNDLGTLLTYDINSDHQQHELYVNADHNEWNNVYNDSRFELLQTELSIETKSLTK